MLVYLEENQGESICKCEHGNQHYIVTVSNTTD